MRRYSLRAGTIPRLAPRRSRPSSFERRRSRPPYIVMTMAQRTDGFSALPEDAPPRIKVVLALLTQESTE